MVAVARGGPVVCPAESADADAARAVLADVAAGRAEANRVRSVLDEPGGTLLADGTGGLISFRQAVATLPPATVTTLADRLAERFGPAADAAVADVRARPDHTVGDLLAVADQFPFTPAVTLARRAAADRARAQGDLVTAAALAGDDPPSTGPGPLPFDAPWVARVNDFGCPRMVPVGSADAMFVCDRGRGVIRFGPGGRPAWRYVPPAGVAAMAEYRPGDTGRGALTIPAVVTDTAGTPQVVVARLGAGLTALRASDGRLFWSTDADAAWAGTAVLGPPTVAGRYVLCVALVHGGPADPAPADAALLSVLAVDLTDGHVLWRCPVGPVYDPPPRLDGLRVQREPEPYRDVAAPTVAGELAIVPDNAGAVVAVDRFTGRLAWARPYAPTAVGLRVRRFNDGLNQGFGRLPPEPIPGLLRWTPAAVIAGDVVWVAPQDLAATMGLDRRTGRVLWQSLALPQDATCVGVAGGRFILGGRTVVAVDPSTGSPAWLAAPPTGAYLTGPPVVRDGRIFVRSSAGLLEVSAADGAVRAAPAGTADFHTVAASVVGRATLTAAGMAAPVSVP